MSGILAELLEDYHRRRALGETPRAEEYAERAGAQYAEFLEILATESALDSAMDLEPPAPLPRAFGAYTLLREIGRGAVGVVYEAHHRRLGRTVALKVLRTGVDTSPAAIERFQREASACAQARHPNLVEVYEAGEHEGQPFYAMSLVRGRTVAELAKSGGLPEPRDLCARLAEVADALHHLHASGIVHRDVKPGNIVAEESGRMVLADFGLARSVEAPVLTQTGEALGTPLYMSPEQLLGRRDQVDARTDVYGLGATLYSLLARRPLFETQGLREIMRDILETRPPPLRKLRPDLPPALDAIVMKAIEKRREDRYATVAAMRDDLLAFARGGRVAGRPVPAAVRLLRGARRRWVPIAASATVLLAAALWLAMRPATLEVASYPEARVWLDGEERGATPLSMEVARGEHELTLRSGGFLESTRRLRLGAGQRHTLDVVLIAEDPNDPETLGKLAAELGLAMATLQEFDGARGALGRPAEARALYPRGDVRVEDVAEYRIDVGEAFAEEGTLEFRAGGEVLFSGPFDPENLVAVAPAPAELVRRLRPGQVVTWGFVPAREGFRESLLAEFTVVERDLSGKLAALAERLKEQPAPALRHLRAQLLLDEGLPFAAYREVAGIASAPAYAIRQRALEAMGLARTAAWEELARAAAGR